MKIWISNLLLTSTLSWLFDWKHSRYCEDTFSWQFRIFHFALYNKLDKRTRRFLPVEEENLQTEFPTLEKLKTYLSNHCKAVEVAQGNDFKPKPVGPKSNLKPSYDRLPTTMPAVRVGQGQSVHRSFVSNAFLLRTLVFTTQKLTVFINAQVLMQWLHSSETNLFAPNDSVLILWVIGIWWINVSGIMR